MAKRRRRKTPAEELQEAMERYVALVVELGEKTLKEAWRAATRASLRWLQREIKRLEKKSRRHWKKRQKEARRLSGQFREGFPI